MADVRARSYRFHNNTLHVEKDLPKTGDYFQMVYGGIEDKSVMGVSKPFCFKEMSDEELVEFVKKIDYAGLVNLYRVIIGFHFHTNSYL